MFSLLLFLWIGLLLLVWSLMAVRVSKLGQIADRWFCLYHLLDKFEITGDLKNYSLEKIVYGKLIKGKDQSGILPGLKRPYTSKDVRLALSLCTIVSAGPLWVCAFAGNLDCLRRVLIVVVFVTFLAFNYSTFAKPFDDPYATKSGDAGTA